MTSNFQDQKDPLKQNEENIEEDLNGTLNLASSSNKIKIKSSTKTMKIKIEPYFSSKDGPKYQLNSPAQLLRTTDTDDVEGIVTSPTLNFPNSSQNTQIEKIRMNDYSTVNEKMRNFSKNNKVQHEP